MCRLHNCRPCEPLPPPVPMLSPGYGHAWVCALSLRGGKPKQTFVTPTETNVHGDALCFMVMGPFLLQRLAVVGRRLVVGCWWLVGLALDGWRLVVVGGWRLVGGWWWVVVGGWRRLAVGGWRLVVVGGWRLVGGWWWVVVGGWLVVGGWRLVVPRGCPKGCPLKKKSGFVRTALCARVCTWAVARVHV